MCWLTVLVYWLWTARHVKPVQRTEARWLRLLVYWLPLVAVGLLLGPGDWFGHSLLRENFVPHTTLVYSIGLAMCIAGAALAIWSRHLLGRNWSSVVQLKQGHELVRAGPYRLVRHPIYSGLLLMVIGNVLMVGDWRGILALAILFASVWRKLRLEERWLTEQFGDAYRAYRTRTKALVPALL